MVQDLRTIAFDADDTLWHNERFFQLTQDRFRALLQDFAEPDHLDERLLEAERRNIGHYGFGVKGFVLSMIETAIEVTDQRVPASVISELIAAGQEMLRYPIELLPHAREAIEALSADHFIMLITKGDLVDQERKLAQSGLGELFDGVEIVTNKTAALYTDVFAKRTGGAAAAMMIGDSMKSDILPALEAGAHAVHVPHSNPWALEQAEAPDGHERFFRLDTLKGLPDLIADLK